MHDEPVGKDFHVVSGSSQRLRDVIGQNIGLLHGFDEIIRADQ